MTERRSGTQFEIMRHGHKKGEGLSEQGIEQAKKKAHELYERLKEIPAPAVIVLFSSNIGRAIDTKRTLESSLLDLVSQDGDFEAVSVKDAEKIDEAKTRTDKKLLITETAPQTMLGYSLRKEDLADSAFQKWRSLYKDESIVGKIWTARKEEIPALKEELRRTHPDIDPSTINPAEFIQTPEEYAFLAVDYVERMDQLSKKHFPDRPTHLVSVSHNYFSDWLTLMAMGKSINVESINELGGTYRDFVESSHLDVGNGELWVDYRGKQAHTPMTIQDVRKKLEKSMKEREKEWKEIE
ncbi:histidine phosphatase family protein [Patescibacteria group bacterium]|nr:MAG: histidine phosphatase family protein [Patescibacteria group bacterium]